MVHGAEAAAAGVRPQAAGCACGGLRAGSSTRRAQRSGRGSGSGSGDGVDDTAVADAAAPVSQPAARVIGTSEIDFYA